MKSSDIEDIQTTFGQMLLRMQSVLYRFCLAYTDGQPANVDDLYQKIVSKLWRAYSRFGHILFKLTDN